MLAAITCDDFVDHGRFGYPVEDMYMLAYQRVRYVGDAIAAVAAETEDALQAGLEAIVVELERCPVYLIRWPHCNPSADCRRAPWDAPEMPRGNLLTRYIVRKGEPDAVLADCAVTLDEEYSTMHQEHAYIETEGALAVPWPGGKGVTVYASCQSPFVNRNNLCRVLGLPEGDVRVIQPQVGGAFGGKDDLMYQTSGQVARLALLTGRPVRMTFDREESMIASYKRDAMQMRIQIGADRDGTLRASKIHAVVDSGAYAAITPFTAWRSSIHAMGPIATTPAMWTRMWPIRTTVTRAHFAALATPRCALASNRRWTNWPASWAWIRSTCACTIACALATRHRTASRLATMWHWPNVWNRCASYPIGIASEPISRRRSPNLGSGEMRRGIGVAAVFHGMSLGAEGADFAVGTLTINDDYSLTLTSGLTDYGTGSRTVFTLIAAETLGLEPERIKMPRPDTEYGDRQRPDGSLARDGVGRQCHTRHGHATRQLVDARSRRSLELPGRSSHASRRALHRPDRRAGFV